ncbi:MAG: hypothetical protein KDA84_06900, partial [Planctomycetaceae bacterium]|nr:hypothetical protein [Planctomycetaceae bacterium]
MLSFSPMLLLANDRLLLLWDVSLKSAVLFAVAMFVCVILRHGSAAVRHRVWTLAVMASLLLPVAGLVLPTLRLPVFPEGFLPAAEPVQIVDDTDRSVEFENRANTSVPKVLIPDKSGKPTPTELIPLQPTSAESPSTKSETPTVVLEEPGKTNPLEQVKSESQSVLVGIWIFGVFVAGFPIVCLGLLRWHRQRGETPIQDAAWNACVNQCAG